MEKCGNFQKNCSFSGGIWSDWGNAAWADMAGLGSIGLSIQEMLVAAHLFSNFLPSKEKIMELFSRGQFNNGSHVLSMTQSQIG